MSTENRTATIKNTKLKWVFVWWLILNICMIPMQLLRKIPGIGDGLFAAVFLIVVVIDSVNIIKCYRNEQSGGELTEFQKTVNDCMGVFASLIKHPVQSIKSEITDIKEADETEKTKKIIRLLVGIIIFGYAVYAVVMLAITAIVTIVLLGAMEGAAEAEAAEEFAKMYGYMPSNAELKKWMGQ